MISALRTPLGTVVIEHGACGIRRVLLPPESERLPVDSPPPASIVAALEDFFAGRPVLAEVPLDLEGTPFQRQVWAAIAAIGPGNTRSYGEIARDLGRPGAARAVGNACGKNPVPLLVPCHRVLKGDGTRGGFSSPMWIKHALLDHEGDGDDLSGSVEPLAP